METAPEGPEDVAHGGPGEVAHGGPGKEEPEEIGLLGIAHGRLAKAAPVEPDEEKPNKTRKTRRKFISQMRHQVSSGPSNQSVGPDVSCRCSLPSTPNTQCGGGPFTAILCRTRVTSDFAWEILSFEEERRRWRQDSV